MNILIFTKQKQTYILNELMIIGGGEGIGWEFGIDMYTLCI